MMKTRFAPYQVHIPGRVLAAADTNPTTCKCDGSDGDPACVSFCKDESPPSATPWLIGGAVALFLAGAVILWDQG